ncbi:ABC transporter ATP-binding protein [Pilimelia terevasa]|uniref:ABC transporter ATP-binding protein n=1 Tax=Pilimelia terevasa TaxID=53372 RepID=A0A8J3BI51_9ACTN|nr:ABC transporter ATP-binding protein [Pilimelia terevasa]GGK16394.1 ABC transporter ATP-binding protein [Pilimelia terevasa]
MTGTGGSMLAVRGLSRRFESRKAPRLALDDVTFDVARGEVLGLLGPNGAGKTTLVRIITTLLLPTSGGATVAGHDVVRDARAVRRTVGLLLGGERGLYSRLTARQNLRYWAALHGLDTRTGRRRVTELLEELGLSDRADEQVRTYSRGMLQRVHLARALLSRAELLIMDEPTNGMDPHAAAAFDDLVRRQRAEGTTVLLATHDMRQAQSLCDRVALIDGGRLRAIGAPDTLLTDAQLLRTVTARGFRAELTPAVRAIGGVLVQSDDDSELVARVTDGAALGALLNALVTVGINEISVTPPSLTELYRARISDRDFQLR